MIFVIFIIFLTHIYQSSYHSKRILAAHMPAISIGTSLEPDWNLIGTSLEPRRYFALYIQLVT